MWNYLLELDIVNLRVNTRNIYNSLYPLTQNFTGLNYLQNLQLDTPRLPCGIVIYNQHQYSITVLVKQKKIKQIWDALKVPYLIVIVPAGGHAIKSNFVQNHIRRRNMTDVSPQKGE